MTTKTPINFVDCPRVSVLIVSYNTREMTLSCIRSVFEQTRSNAEIIVVDNNSHDGSADAISKEFPDIRLIRSKINSGFARSNNIAARLSTADYILLLNPDTIILDRGIDRLLDFSKDNLNAGIWGGRTLFRDGALNPTSCWRFNSLWTLFCQAVGLASFFRHSPFFNREGYGGWARDSVRQVDIVTGCFLLISRALWDQLRGFDETFFMYGEEADLCYRARLMGASPLFTPAATIVHYDGASEPVFSAKVVRLLKGKVTFLRKHWIWPKQKAGILFLDLMVLARSLGYGVLARMTRSPLHAAISSEWSIVWSARGEWHRGYGG